MKSSVRHAGETVGMAAATAGTAVAVVATVGQVDSVNNAVKG